MMYISLFICTVLVIFLVLFGRKNKGRWYDRSCHSLLQWMKRRGWNIPNWVNEKFIFQSWMILFLGNLVLILCAYWFDARTITQLEKPINGEGSVWEDVEMIWEDEKGKKHTEKFQIEVKEQQMEQEELEKKFAEIKNILKEEIVGENASLDFVSKPLYMPEKLEKYDAEISWYSDSPWFVHWDGTLGENIPEEGIQVNLTATILLQSKEDILEVQVIAFPKEYNWLEDLKTVIAEFESESLWVELPKEWNGISLEWKKDKSTLFVFLTIVVLGAPVLMFFKKKQEMEEIEKRQRQQMLQDYPEILSKLMLLLSAGMSLRRAIEKIVFDYKKYYEKKERRTAYELLADVCSEINRGVTEKQAYERIGERSELLQYKTLSALLVQHLQKGNRSMEYILAEEVRRAQELRQQQAKIMGEQASAKLLFPMILMLLDVFIILIVPAWISFSV